MIKFYVYCSLFLFSQIANGQEDAPFFEKAHLKTAEIPVTYTEMEKPGEPASVTVDVDFAEVVTPVSRFIFGNNANVYMTQMVDQPVLLGHIKKLSPNVIRFPGGNLSSVFFWNAAPGGPPADAPAKLLDANGNQIDPGYWFGKNTEGWTLSVDNYYKMLEATGSTGIITINYGYARYSTADDPVASAAHMAAEWVRYDNGRTKFWEIGNESNGTWQAGHRINIPDNKDGQPAVITGELYGAHFKVFADSMRAAAAELGVAIYLGAQLLAEEPASWWNSTDRLWNEGVFDEAQSSPDYYIIHSYYTPYQTNSNPLDILNSATTVTTNMMDYVTSSIAEKGLSQKPLALTEWNIFAEGSKQQASYINGMHAAIVLGELIKNQYGLACRWDLANGWANGNDHGMFSQGDEPGVPKWHPRAAFFYMYYFQKYFGDHMLFTSVSGTPEVLSYASKFSSGETSLVIVNKNSTSQTVRVNIGNFGFGERFYLHTLTGGIDNGAFSLKVFVNGSGSSLPSGGPADVAAVKSLSGAIGGAIKFTAPPKSVNYLLVEDGDNLITGVEGDDETSIRVYPIPANKMIHVRLPSPGFSRVEIIDRMGEQVFEMGADLSERTLDVPVDLPSGVYILLLHKGNSVRQKKIIIY